MAATRADDPNGMAWLDQLGGSYLRRFEQAGDPSDLDAAIHYETQAVSVMPEDHPVWALSLSTLGVGHLRRFFQTGALTDLNAAIDCGHRSVAAAADDDPLRAMCLSNLGLSYRTRFERTGDRSDLDVAIDCGTQAVSVTREDNPYQGLCLHNLAQSYETRYRRNPVPEDLEVLDAAIDCETRAVSATPVDHPDRAARLLALGDMHILRCGPTQTLTGLSEGIRVWREAASSVVAPVEVRMKAARRWGRIAAAAGDPAGATEGFAVAVGLLPVMAWRGLSRTVQEERLTASRGLACQAAAWAIEAGQLERAVELLEQGRSVLWSQILQLRTGELPRLRRENPDLAARLDAVRAALDRRDGGQGNAATVSASVGESTNDSELMARQRRRWAEEWERLIAEVRALDGYAGFLEPKPFGPLSRVADSGPVILVNLDDHRCDALIVSGGRVRLCRLPGLTLGDCVTWADRLLSAFTDRRGLDAGVARANRIQVVFAVLEWLWDTICRPVLTDLGYLGATWTGTAAQLPRVWWCPTGPLTLLPLHAAGRYRDPGAGRLCDAAVSSYTPTLTALLGSRDRVAHGAHPQVTVIGMPTTPDTADLRFPDLPAVPFELSRVTARLPTADILRSATREELEAGAQPLAIPPTTRRVLDSLTHSIWIHLACHAGQNLTDPANGALYFVDGPLTLARIVERDLTDAELAFLSACQTAVGGVDLLDEVIHLAAALQLAGYRHVIASQWSISDTHAPDVADDVYANLATDCPDATRAAVALHQAVGALRDRQPHRPDLWAVYLHVGP